MKAHVKINVSIQVEPNDNDPTGIVKYPFAAHHAGTIDVADRDEAERVILALGNHVNRTFEMMGVVRATGEHKPDLALAFGGCPEPKKTEGCFTCGGIGCHSNDCGAGRRA